MGRKGVLVTAFGGPSSLEGVAPFMRSVMGREPSEEAMTEAWRKYLTIGGVSPLPSMAERMAAQLERELNGLERGESDDGDAPLIGTMALSTAGIRATGVMKLPVAVGFLHSEPTIARAVGSLLEEGVRELVVVSLSPFQAQCTTGAYRAAVDAALENGPKVQVFDAAAYHRSDDLVTALSDSLNESLHDADILKNRGLVVFTAHSLPQEDVDCDPTYIRQLEETAASVAAGVGLGEANGFDALPGIEAFGGKGLTAPWLLAFQSRGRRPGAWTTPDLDDVLDGAIAAGFEVVVVCPVGFAVDHMETLYDLDVLAADKVLGAGLEFVRAGVPNDSPKMITALAEAVRRVL